MRLRLQGIYNLSKRFATIKYRGYLEIWILVLVPVLRWR